MNKKIFFFIMPLLVITLIAFTSAAKPNQGPFKLGENITFTQGCNNGTDICDSCNISIISDQQDGHSVVQNIRMTKLNGLFNYTLPDTSNNQSGRFDVLGICFAGNLLDDFKFWYEVNPQGILASESRTNALSRSIWFIFGISILLFLAFLFFNSSMPLKLTFLFGAIIFALIALNIVFLSLQDEVVNPKLESLFSGLTAVSYYMYWFAAGLLALLWIFTFMNTWIYKKNLQNARRYGLG